MARTKTYCGIGIAALTCLSTLEAQSPRDRMDLNGRWEFRTGSGQNFPDRITVPGAWQAQGFGAPAGNLRHHYAGSGWYRRRLDVPAGWAGKDVVLRIGGAHRRATVFVNGIEMGGHDGFSAPFEFNVTRAVRPGAANEIVLRIDNPAVSIEASPDKQQAKLPAGMLNYIGNWGGIYGDVTLDAVPAVRVDSVLVIPDVEHRKATFRIAVRGSESAGPLTARVSVPSAQPASVPITEGEAAVTVSLPDAPLWTPENPALLAAGVELLRNGREIDRFEQRFGFRQFTTRGNVLLLNGKPIYLRGYGDDNVEVLTGFPPSSRAVFLERLKLAKSFGFNAVRFHSMTPPAGYFEAADEVGILVMAELPAAYTQYFFTHFDYLKQELRNVLLAYRNHPSLLTLAFGNEFNLNWLKSDADRQTFLAAIANFYSTAKKLAPATLIMSNDGYDMRPTDIVSLFRAFPGDRPAVRHEFGQYYCSLPDISLIDRFTGVMAPEWLEAKKKWIIANRLDESYPVYLRNSKILQHLGRKFQIERARTNPNVTGYHYWLIVDFPGGTGEGDSWEEGWFDYFWQPKITPEQGRELNSPVLLLLDAGPDARNLWAGENRSIRVQVSNYGAGAIRNGTLAWTVTDNGTRVSGGVRGGIDAPLGTVSAIGEITVDASTVSTAKKLDLVVSLRDGDLHYTNRWSFWVYPRFLAWPAERPVVSAIRSESLRQKYPWLLPNASTLTPETLLITEELDTRAVTHLRAGGRVWLMLAQTPERRGIPFFPAAGGAFGTVIPAHAATRGFPNEGFCDLQFYNLLNGAFPLPVDQWPVSPEPIIGGIRTTSEFLSKTKNLSRVAYAVEGNALGGKLLITSLRLREHLDEQYPEALAFFDSVLRYASGSAFSPRGSVPEQVVQRLTSE